MIKVAKQQNSDIILIADNLNMNGSPVNILIT